MEFRLLESFVAVAEAGSVTAAARRLRISQPSLSQQMQRLEAELGVALLDRRAGSRGVALTPSGEALLVEARGLLAHRRRSVAVVRAVGDDAPVPVVLGLTLGVTPAYVSRIVDRIQADLPAVQVGLADPGSTSTQLDALRSRELDLSLVRLPADTGDVRVLPLRTERMGVWMFADDPLVAGAPDDEDELPLEALHGRAVYSFERDFLPAFYDQLTAAFDAAGVAPHWVPLRANVASLYVPAIARTALPFSVRETPFDHGDLVWRAVAGLPLLTTALVWLPESAPHVHECARAVSHLLD